jgi:glycosyltransferase involved in cell wall biosynthesis
MIRERLEAHVDRLTVVSDELGAVLRANGLPVHRRVHNALQLQERLPTREEVVAFRKDKDLGEDPVIAIGGRLHEQKGVGQLLAMLPGLLAEFPALKVMVMGKRAVYDQEFAAEAEALGVDHAMVPTGWLDGDELQCAYSAVDVFVTPSICFDTFGLVNLEAMEHSRPVVATTFGGSQEVVVDGVTGRIANPFDLEAFSGAILELLRDPERAEAMGRAGRERLLEKFTIERLCDEYDEEYERALASR